MSSLSRRLRVLRQDGRGGGMFSRVVQFGKCDQLCGVPRGLLLLELGWLSRGVCQRVVFTDQLGVLRGVPSGTLLYKLE